jgi:hypothetical protein
MRSVGAPMTTPMLVNLSSLLDDAKCFELVLQLHIKTFLSVRESGSGLMSSSPLRPLEDEGGRQGLAEKEPCQQPQDLWRRAEFGDCEGYAASVWRIGLVSFRFPNALRR